MSVGAAALGAHRTWVRVRDKAFSIAVSGSFDHYGTRSVIRLPTRLDGTEYMRVGPGVHVGPGSWLQALEQDDRPRPLLEIGDGSSLTGNVVLSCASSIRLGRSVLLARNVYVADHRHAFDDSARPISRQGIEDLAPVVLEDGCWLGQNVVVGPGVTVGRGAVVGANSVVLDDVPPRSVAVGAPARVVRSIDDDAARDALVHPAGRCP